MQIERKHRDSITLSFDQSPKILLSTNYIIGGTGPSHDDRIFEVEFSDYYGLHHRPLDDFGRRFFDDWDAEQWNQFDNFMLSCVRFYMIHGLVDYKRVNLAERKVQQMTSRTFTRTDG